MWTKEKKTAEPMNKACDAPKIVLENGTRISCTYIPNVHGHTVMNMWVVSPTGTHIAARSFKVCCLTPEEKAEKISGILNDLKLEIVCYEAGAVAEKTHNDIAKMMDFITKRYAQLNIKKQ